MQRPEEGSGCSAESLSALSPKVGSLTALGARLVEAKPQWSSCFLTAVLKVCVWPHSALVLMDPNSGPSG